MFDAIIVFGGGINPDGTLEENSRVRVAKAVQLWKQGKALVMVMSGAWSFSRKEIPIRTEAAAMAEYAEKLGGLATAILREDRSKDTIGNAYFVKTLLAIPNHWKNLLVVVSDYHVARTKHLCEKIFGPDYQIDVKGATLPMSQAERDERMVREQTSTEVFDEWFPITSGDDAAIEKLLQDIHPAYSKHPRYSIEGVHTLIAERVKKIQQEKRIT